MVCVNVVIFVCLVFICVWNGVCGLVVCSVVCSVVWFLVGLMILFVNIVLWCVLMFVLCVSCMSRCIVLLLMWFFEKLVVRLLFGIVKCLVWVGVWLFFGVN